MLFKYNATLRQISSKVLNDKKSLYSIRPFMCNREFRILGEKTSKNGTNNIQVRNNLYNSDNNDIYIYCFSF